MIECLQSEIESMRNQKSNELIEQQIEFIPPILSCWVIGWCQSWLLEFNFHFRKFQFNQSANEVNYLNWRNQSRNQLIAVNWIELNELKTFNSVNEIHFGKFSFISGLINAPIAEGKLNYFLAVAEWNETKSALINELNKLNVFSLV